MMDLLKRGIIAALSPFIRAVIANLRRIVREEISACQNAMLVNNLSLANNIPGMRLLRTPWSARSHFMIYKTEDGRISIYPLNKENNKTKPVFIISIPKSGTHLLAKILTILGFYGVDKVMGLSTSYLDSRGFDIPDFCESHPNFQYVHIPYDVQIGLVLPGQIHKAHFENIEQIRLLKLHGVKSVLFIIRDIRHILISHMRHLARAKGHDYSMTSFTSSDLVDYLHRKEANILISLGGEAIKILNEPYIHVIHFEDLAFGHFPDINRAVASICQATECEHDQVKDAILKARNTYTVTWTGNVSSLTGIWNDEAEQLFVKKGGDLINEKLGYPKHYTPESYPEGIPIIRHQDIAKTDL